MRRRAERAVVVSITIPCLSLHILLLFSYTRDCQQLSRFISILGIVNGFVRCYQYVAIARCASNWKCDSIGHINGIKRGSDKNIFTSSKTSCCSACQLLDRYVYKTLSII